MACNCSGTCSGGCTGSCNTSCLGGCVAGCNGLCSGGCSHCSNCRGGCQTSCGTACTGGCSGSCGDCGGCSGTCQYTCSGSCSGDCNNGCQSEAKNALIANFPLDDIIKASDLNQILESIESEIQRRNKTKTSPSNVSVGGLALNTLRDSIYNDLLAMDSSFSTIKNTKMTKAEMLTYIDRLKILMGTNLKS